MGKLSWVAANALLLSLALGMAGVTNNAWAQEAPGTGLPTVEDPPKGGEPEVEGPAVKMPDDCFLQGRHFNFLEQQIAALEAEAARLKAQITALEVGSPQLVEQITTLNQRLAQINERLGDAYLAAYPWSGWHFRLGMLIQGTAFSGSTNFVAPLQLDVSGEVIDPRTHLGWRGGGALGVTFTEGETSGKTLAPFMVTGYMSAVAGWEYWSVLLPEVRASFLRRWGVPRRGHVLHRRARGNVGVQHPPASRGPSRALDAGVVLLAPHRQGVERGRHDRARHETATSRRQAPPNIVRDAQHAALNRRVLGQHSPPWPAPPAAGFHGKTPSVARARSAGGSVLKSGPPGACKCHFS